MAGNSKSSAIKGLDLLYEFEREPVSEDKLQPGKHFAGVYAGEHVAGAASRQLDGCADLDVRMRSDSRSDPADVVLVSS
jgi:hypothetical protein